MSNTSPPKIKGYRELSEKEIALVNEFKTLGEIIGLIFTHEDVKAIADPRWLSIAQTHIQQGFMALSRAVLKPTTFA